MAADDAIFEIIIFKRASVGDGDSVNLNCTRLAESTYVLSFTYIFRKMADLRRNVKIFLRKLAVNCL